MSRLMTPAVIEAQRLANGVASLITAAEHVCRGGRAAELTGLPTCAGCGEPCPSASVREARWRALYGAVFSPAGPAPLRVYACSVECLVAAIMRLDADGYPIGVHEVPYRGTGEAAFVVVPPPHEH